MTYKVFPLEFENETVGTVRINDDGSIDAFVIDSDTPKAVEAREVLYKYQPPRYSFTLHRPEPPAPVIYPVTINGEEVGEAEVYPNGEIRMVRYFDTPLAKEVQESFNVTLTPDRFSIVDWESEIDKWRKAWLRDLPELKLDKKKIRWPKRIF